MHGTPLLGMKVEFLPPNVSDHSQVSVRTVDTIDFGPKPFKFHSFWLKHEQFSDVLRASWSLVVVGNPLKSV